MRYARQRSSDATQWLPARRRLEAAALGAGADPGMVDAIVAGIAEAHGLVVVTRNVKHFQPFGVAVLTPETVR